MQRNHATKPCSVSIKLAHSLGIKRVITTEGDPKTPFGENLSYAQKIFSVVEKLQSPIAWAKEYGIELLLEPHGILTDSVSGMSDLLSALGNEDVMGVNLDTGNVWLGAGEPLEFIEKFGERIKHVHWKDMEEPWVPKRGTLYGCGMGTIPVVIGVVGIQSIVSALQANGFDGPTMLEVAGEENMKVSADCLRCGWQ